MRQSSDKVRPSSEKKFAAGVICLMLAVIGPILFETLLGEGAFILGFVLFFVAMHLMMHDM